MSADTVSLGVLIPPRRVRRLPGAFRWPDAARLASPTLVDRLPLEQLADELRRNGVGRVRLAFDAASPAAVRIRRSPEVKAPEGYRLTITPDGIEILAREDRGAFYALQSLRELVRLHGRRLPACRIDDWPDFARRGAYLDCARGKIPTLDTLKGLVERLAHWKYNELQLYIENAFAFQADPEIGRGFSPFTPADLLALQAFAKQHHVRLVGSMASFGHMEMVLRLPRFRHLAELPGWYGYAGGTTLSAADRRSSQLVKTLYDEFVPLFEAEDFNACGDEPWELGQGRSQGLCARRGKGQVYLDFMKKIDHICRAHGKRTNLWADIVLKHPELLKRWPQDIVMLNWAYQPTNERIRKTRAIAEAGLPFMVCPSTNTWGSHGSRLSTAFANAAVFAAQGRAYGAEGLLHTDWGDGGHRNTLAVSLCSFAQAGAQAWNGRAVAEDRAFVRAFCRQTFGQRNNRLADALKVLGGICEHCGNATVIYSSLRQSIAGTRRAKLLRADHNYAPGDADLPRLAAERLAEAVTMLAPLLSASAWPALPASADAFDRLTLAEYRLAARQDQVSCRRLLLADRRIEGQPVTAREWRQLERDLAELSVRFADLWQRRNRPSRLAENLKLMECARRESRMFAQGQSA
ncbi:MAG: beta-N-acetylhexosaminidase [Candidatus Marinimicrobia bacterium]|nr:beta-N-acetylhexosaminidase [Candidatus Neomarinimicrobiota bacterium]